MQVEADKSTMTKEQILLQGNVIAQQGQDVFLSERFNYERYSKQIDVPTHMTYANPSIAISADKAQYSLAKETGHFQHADYYLSVNNGIGSARHAKIDRKAKTEDLDAATFSTCPRGKQAWSIKANELHIDHNEGIAEVWHAQFRVGKIPIFYFPYFNFPIDNRRKTGFLVPSVNLSDSRGSDITLPYYINIAPNQDATLYPRFMQKRGFMLGAEYRYLLPKLNGHFSATFLSKDKKTQEKRWSIKSKHFYRSNSRFSLLADVERVSDENYIEDFNNTLDLSSKKFTQSQLLANYYYADYLTFSGRITDYRVANKAYTIKDRPYNLLPSLSALGSWHFDNGLILNTHSELSNFDKENILSGLRFNQEIKLSYPMQRSYGFIKPQAIYRFTDYRLRRQGKGEDAHLSRAVPSFSVDSGLIFDREMTWFSKAATQTLEPRLFYLYTPYKKQSNLPDFDAAKISHSYDALFFNNRFAGKDRIGDANQLTTALSSTISDRKTGEELATISLGQIQYFADRKVSLHKTIEKASRSSLMAQTRIKINNRFKIHGFVHYNTDIRHNEKSLLGLTYQSGLDKAYRLSHLYDDDNYKQLDMAGVWRINPRWRAFWRWNYSINYKKTADILLGAEYTDCCWATRLLFRKHRDSVKNDEKLESSIFLELVLNGLGNIGSSTGYMLDEVIPHYRPIDYEKKH